MLLQQTLANCLIDVQVQLSNDDLKSVLVVVFADSFKLFVVLKHKEDTVHELL